MEFIRKINKTEMVTVERMVPTYYEEEQTREVFVIELSRQDVQDLLDVYRGVRARNYSWCGALAGKMEFILDLRDKIHPKF